MKPAVIAGYCFLLTVLLIGLLGVLVGQDIFSRSSTNPASPSEMALFYLFLGAIGVWVISSLAGYVMLMRRGFFADQIEFLAAGNEWLGCFLGIFVLAGLWVALVIPGPYVMWFAATRAPRPLCPQCKNWMPRGVSRCAHCGAELAGTAPEQPQVPVPMQPAEMGRCENCGAISPAGACYSFGYGTYAGSEYLGRRTTRYIFKISGMQDVYLCDRCVSAYAQKRVKRISLALTLGLVAMLAGLVLCSVIPDITGADITRPTLTPPLVIFTLALGPLAYLMMQRQARRQPLLMGDMLAIQLRKPALKSQGYTRFYTRQQLRDNKLL